MLLIRGVDFYQELGASAFDEEDGVLPVTITGEVDDKVGGIYTIVYSVKDSSGNSV